MIWIWLENAILWIRGLYIRPLPDPRIDPNAKCPGCGNYGGSLDAVNVSQGELLEIMIRHTCFTCGGRWFEKTVLEGGKNLIHPRESHG
jgi:hypothetical protein